MKFINSLLLLGSCLALVSATHHDAHALQPNMHAQIPLRMRTVSQRAEKRALVQPVQEEVGSGLASPTNSAPPSASETPPKLIPVPYNWDNVTAIIDAALREAHMRTPSKRLLAEIPVVGDILKAVSNYPKWDWTDKNAKVYGVNLGNWLLLERWMDEQWFTGLAGSDTPDMWNFMKKLSPEKALAALTVHYNTYITELDVISMAKAGLTHVRVPVGYWSLIPVKGDEPYRDFGEMQVIERLLALLAAHGMYATLDMHGLPGSQSGDQASGHATSNPQWFTPDNQKRSDQMMDNLITFIQNSPFKNVVSSVLPVNEPCGPRGCSADRLQITRDYYERSYQKLKAAGIPMIFHHGFVPGGLSGWLDFVQGKDPAYLIGSDNPYVAFFPAKTDRSQIYSALCSKVRQYTSYPVPVIASEWSLAGGINGNDWLTTFYNAQAQGYAKAAGSTMWSYRCEGCLQWSWRDLNAMGIIAQPTLGQTTQQFLAGLPGGQC